MPVKLYCREEPGAIYKYEAVSPGCALVLVKFIFVGTILFIAANISDAPGDIVAESVTDVLINTGSLAAVKVKLNVTF